jgi:hypothetical protein
VKGLFVFIFSFLLFPPSFLFRNGKKDTWANLRGGLGFPIKQTSTDVRICSISREKMSMWIVQRRQGASKGMGVGLGWALRW